MTAQIPLIVCTTNIQALGERQAWLTRQEIQVVTKPFDADDLALVVEHLMRNAEAPSRGAMRRETGIEVGR